MVDFEEFLDKISPLKTANKLGTILIQLPPSFTVNDFKNIEGFLDRLPPSSSFSSGYDYAVEFRHPSWSTEVYVLLPCKRKFAISIGYYYNYC